MTASIYLSFPSNNIWKTSADRSAARLLFVNPSKSSRSLWVWFPRGTSCPACCFCSHFTAQPLNFGRWAGRFTDGRKRLLWVRPEHLVLPPDPQNTPNTLLGLAAPLWAKRTHPWIIHGTSSPTDMWISALFYSLYKAQRPVAKARYLLLDYPKQLSKPGGSGRFLATFFAQISSWCYKWVCQKVSGFIMSFTNVPRDSRKAPIHPKLELQWRENVLTWIPLHSHLSLQLNNFVIDYTKNYCILWIT